MSAEAVFWQQATKAISRSVPDMVYLFDSFLRRKAAKFRAISQDGLKLKRVTLIAALAVTCGLVALVIYKLDPLDGLEGVMPSPERALWTALAPVLAAFLAYWLVRWRLPAPILATYLNLGLVTCIALTAIPGILILAGANVSSLASDVRQLRAGRGAGTPVHQIYCGSLEERAEIGALMRRLERNSDELAQNGRALEAQGRMLLENTRLLAPNAARLRALRVQIDEAGGPERVDPAVNQAFFETVREGFPIVQRGMRLAEQGQRLQLRGLNLQREGLDIQYRALDLRDNQSTIRFRLLGAYPVATAFLIVAVIIGWLIWLISAVIAWRLTVSPQPTKRRKALVGSGLVLVFLIVSVGFNILRSGLVEVWTQEVPSLDMIDARLRSEFAAAAPMCGRLNNHGLW